MAKRKRSYTHTAAYLAKQSAKIIDDRINYLSATTARIVTAPNKREAERMQSNALNTLGVKYDVQSRFHNGRKEYRLQRRAIQQKAVEKSSEMQRIYRGLASKSKSARGAKAKALEQLGRRDTFWDFAVGDTNE
jgi:signal recognition particle subunit SEC65